MKTLNEVRILPNIHLSDSQKVVLAKIKAAATETVAHEQITNGVNLVQASKTLNKLGLINMTANSVTITDKGMQNMNDENLTDQSGELSDDGKKYAQITEPNDLAHKDDDKDADASAGDGLGMPPAPAPDAGGELGESLFAIIHRKASIREDLDQL